MALFGDTRKLALRGVRQGLRMPALEGQPFIGARRGCEKLICA